MITLMLPKNMKLLNYLFGKSMNMTVMDIQMLRANLFRNIPKKQNYYMGIDMVVCDEERNAKMLHHIIVKWNDTVDKKDLAQKVRILYADATKISGVHNVAIKENITPRNNRYDLMIALEMDNDALLTWDNSELHKKWKSEFDSVIEKKCIFDCE